MPIDETRYFISYTRDDSDFVLKLAKELRAAGANLWVDQLDLVGGQRWARAVQEALVDCQGMIIVLSPESVASNNVEDEVAYALDKNKLVVPVLYKECDVPIRLWSLQRIDFTADYDKGFVDLLRALRIAQSEPTLAPAEAEASVVEDVAESEPQVVKKTTNDKPTTKKTDYPGFC